MKRYFLFDLDGTLTDTGSGIMGSVAHALARLGWPEPEADFLRQFVGPPLEESFQNFCQMSPAEAAEAIRLYRERYHAWGVFQSPLYPGVEGLLERLSQKAALAVATSKREAGARQILAMRGVEGYFQAVVVGEALAQLEEPPREQVVMIGDRSYDVAGAKAWGLESIGVLYGYSAPGELAAAGASRLVGSVAELEALCRKLAEA
ncbi:HAD hydrolase-like protein [Acutalibacter sp.]|uniref:HAD hydrolase-like protein n=1 Tax=Acutalibacter sp. TaxID=1918636 RepID=UPI002172E71E|nr:HAD hydrolase-like protein [Acutalibacter sp.]